MRGHSRIFSFVAVFVPNERADGHRGRVGLLDVDEGFCFGAQEAGVKDSLNRGSPGEIGLGFADPSALDGGDEPIEIQRHMLALHRFPLCTINVVANAQQDRVPLIILTGCVDADEALTYTHQVLDHEAVFRSITKATFRLTAIGADTIADVNDPFGEPTMVWGISLPLSTRQVLQMIRW